MLARVRGSRTAYLRLSSVRTTLSRRSLAVSRQDRSYPPLPGGAPLTVIVDDEKLGTRRCPPWSPRTSTHLQSLHPSNNPASDDWVSRALGPVLGSLDRGTRVTALVGLPGAGKTWLLDRLVERLSSIGRVVTRLAPQLPLDGPGVFDTPGVVACDGVALDRLAELVPRLGPRTQLVFASRRRPPFPATLVELGPLPRASAADEGAIAPASRLLSELLTTIAPQQAPTSPADWTLVHRLADLADGLPGALVLVAEAARLMDLATLARRAEAEPALIFGPLIQVLADDLDARSPSERTALSRLSVCVGGVLSRTAEVLVGDLANGRALDLLRTLRDHHLLSQRGPRLVVPRLLSAALGTERHPTLRSEVALRLSSIAEQTAEQAERRGDSNPLEWVGDERENLLTALTVLSGSQEAWPLLHALLVERWRGTAPPSRTHRQRLVELLERNLDSLPDPLPATLHPTAVQAARVGFDHRDPGLLSRITEQFEKKAPASFALAWARAALAMVVNAPDLRERLERAREVARATGDRLLQGQAALLVSGALGVLDPRAADDAAHEARDHFEAAGYGWGLASALGNLSYFAVRRGEVDAARLHGKEAIAVAERSGDKKSWASALGNLGLLELDQGELSRARDLLEHSKATHTPMGRPDFVAACLNGLARVAIEAAGLSPDLEAARELDRIEGALIEIERQLADADRRAQHLDSALARAEIALLRGDTAGSREALDAALSLPELNDRPGLLLLLNARRAVLEPETSAPHRAAVADLLNRVPPSAERCVAQVYLATWCTEPEWQALIAELARLARSPLARTSPQGLAPAWNNNALVRAALRTTWPLLSESRRQDLEMAARDPHRQHLVLAPSTGRFRMPGHEVSDVSRRPLLVSLLALLVSGRERSMPLDEPTIGEALWPGERMLEDARSNRIQNAVSLLRKAGLKDHLERVDDAYRLDPRLPFIVVSGARELLV